MPPPPSMKRPSEGYLARIRSPGRSKSLDATQSHKERKASDSVRSEPSLNNRKPEPPKEWLKQRAAKRIQEVQRKKRELIKGASSSRVGKVMMAPITAIHDAKLDLDQKINMRVQAFSYRFVENFIQNTLRSQCTEDPWLEKQANDDLVRWLDVVLEEIKERHRNELLETTGSASAALQAELKHLVQPENWPCPPPICRNPFVWARAKFLYAIFPADKNATYKSVIEPWMGFLDLLFYCPYGVSTVMWLVYTLLILLTVDDEYQLFISIVNFRSFAFQLEYAYRTGSSEDTESSTFTEQAFFFWGLLPIVQDYLALYIALTSGHPFQAMLRNAVGPVGAAHVARNISETDLLRVCIDGGPSTSLFDQVQDRLFLLNWFLCWACFARFKWLRRARLNFERTPPVYTGDLNQGDAEVRYAMWYDVGVTALVVVLAFFDLTYRILGLAGLADFFRVTFYSLTWASLVSENHTIDLFFSAFTTGLGWAALPFLLFKTPGLGDLLHQMRATGFDQAGKLRLQMDLPMMKRKQELLAKKKLLDAEELSLLKN